MISLEINVCFIKVNNMTVLFSKVVLTISNYPILQMWGWTAKQVYQTLLCAKIPVCNVQVPNKTRCSNSWINILWFLYNSSRCEDLITLICRPVYSNTVPTLITNERCCLPWCKLRVIKGKNSQSFKVCSKLLTFLMSEQGMLG